MEAINHSLFNNSKLANLLAQASQGSLDPQYGVNTRTKARAELEITTAEGDRVTLLSQSKLRAAYAGYDSQGKLTGTESSVSTNIYQIVTTNNVAIAVEGNLNEEELADIRNLLQSVEDMFTNFISGDGTMEESLAASLSLDSMKTLSLLRNLQPRQCRPSLYSLLQIQPAHRFPQTALLHKIRRQIQALPTQAHYLPSPPQG